MYGAGFISPGNKEHLAKVRRWAECQWRRWGECQRRRWAECQWRHQNGNLAPCVQKSSSDEQSVGKASCKGGQCIGMSGKSSASGARSQSCLHCTIIWRAHEPCKDFEGNESYTGQSEGHFKPPYTHGLASILSNTWPS